MNQHDHQRARAAAIEWAQGLLRRDDFIILDTETTGLGSLDEIVQLAIIDHAGATLLGTLVRPTCAIGVKAKEVHGISEELVRDAPTIRMLLNTLFNCLAGKKSIISYNATFDARMLWQSFHASGVPITLTLSWECAMEQYAAYVGEWSEYHLNYKYQRLPGGDHSALGDALATLRLIQKMAGGV